MNDLQKIRNEYLQKSLSEVDVAEDPFEQFKTWFDEVLKSEVHEPTACTLSTANRNGKPSGRIILLKGFSTKGFTFFTNYDSRKGQDMLENPVASLTFFWKELERQVRIEGSITKTSKEESDNYFQSRPTGSKIGAWASPQSKEIDGREVLEKSEKSYKEKYGNDIPRPNHWGGYILFPEVVEFWQGRASRLHDRLTYIRDTNSWKVIRLAP